MAATIATLALIIALGALWFTCEVTRRADVRNKTVLRPHLEPVNEALERTEEHIRNLTYSLESMEREVRALKSLREEMLAESVAKDGATASSLVHAPWQQGSEDEAPNFRPTATYNS